MIRETVLHAAGSEATVTLIRSLTFTGVFICDTLERESPSKLKRRIAMNDS